MIQLLIIESDPQERKQLQELFKDNQRRVFLACDLKEASALLGKTHFDLIILETTLPDGSGLDLCRKIRSLSDSPPLIFLSHTDDEKTIVEALNQGADDYVVKPYSSKVLKARADKLLSKKFPSNSPLKRGELIIDPALREVRRQDKVVRLGKKEFDIFYMLARRMQDVVSREKILETLYDDDVLFDRTIDSHISHLRKKLGQLKCHSLKIISIYGQGYKLESKKA